MKNKKTITLIYKNILTTNSGNDHCEAHVAHIILQHFLFTNKNSEIR